MQTPALAVAQKVSYDVEDAGAFAMDFRKKRGHIYRLKGEGSRLRAARTAGVAASIVCFLSASMSAGQDASVSAPQTPSTQAAKPGQRPANPTQEIAREQPEGPALAVGPARFRVGGYLGVTGIYRSTNSGGGTGTNFGTILYEDSVQGKVSETRLSAQSSRLSLRVDADFPEPETRFRRLSGYFEMDFGGATPGTVAVTTTSVGFRLRQAFAEVQYGRTVFLAVGQAFTLMTAQKDQLSMWPSDVEVSQAVDTNFVAGMIWDRTPQVRLTWRPSPRINWAVSLENPEQQLGRGLVVLPACCAGDIDAQYNTGADELEVPNLLTDIVTRVAFNPIKALHVDVGGVVRVFRHTVAPYDDDFKDVGGGASINARYNVTAGTRLLMQTGFGSGFGRYIGGLVPDAAFRRDGSIRTHRHHVLGGRRGANDLAHGVTGWLLQRPGHRRHLRSGHRRQLYRLRFPWLVEFEQPQDSGNHRDRVLSVSCDRRTVVRGSSACRYRGSRENPFRKETDCRRPAPFCSWPRFATTCRRLFALNTPS